jgi:hypothetical protein
LSRSRRSGIVLLPPPAVLRGAVEVHRNLPRLAQTHDWCNRHRPQAAWVPCPMLFGNAPMLVLTAGNQ